MREGYCYIPIGGQPIVAIALMAAAAVGIVVGFTPDRLPAAGGSDGISIPTQQLFFHEEASAADGGVATDGSAAPVGKKEAMTVHPPFVSLQGRVELGLPEQSLLIDFSTGRLGFVVVGTSCTDEKPYCQQPFYTNYMRTRFNKSDSDTYTEGTSGDEFSTNLGQGKFGTDNLKLSGSGLVIRRPGIRVGVLDSLDEGFKYRAADGLFGLAPSREATSSAVTALDRLLSAAGKPIFTVWMQDVDTSYSSSNDATGQITFGGFDTEHCGKEWSPIPMVTEAVRWRSDAMRVSFAGSEAAGTSYCGQGITTAADGSNKACPAYTVFFDSGVNTITAPEEFIAEVARRVNATYSPPAEFYVDCAARDSLPALEITFGVGDKAVKASLPASAYVSQMPGGGGSCRLVFTTAQKGSDWWVLGAPFYRRYCVVHNMGKNRHIGIADSFQPGASSGDTDQQQGGQNDDQQQQQGDQSQSGQGDQQQQQQDGDQQQGDQDQQQQPEEGQTQEQTQGQDTSGAMQTTTTMSALVGVTVLVMGAAFIF